MICGPLPFRGVCFVLCVLSVVFVGARTALASVVINEILYSADPTNDGGEFIELTNTGNDTVDVGGWILGGAVDFTFPPNTEIGPGQFVVVARGEVEAEAFYGTDVIGEYLGALSNGGDRILLQNNGFPRAVVDVVEYGDTLPWPTEADGGGPSLELLDASLDNSDPESWAPGESYSPGAANSPGVVNDGDIALTEIMYKPRREEEREKFDRVNVQGSPYFEEGDDLLGEYIEIFNRGAETVDLSGWWFSDGIEYVFSDGTTLDSGQYLVICADPDITSIRFGIENVVGPITGSLDDGGERLTLRKPNGDLGDTVQFDDRAPWPSAPDEFGVSLEVVDVDEDNGSAANWRSSTREFPPIQSVAPEPTPDEGGWSRTFVSGQATSNRLYLYTEDVGEWLVDDISITAGAGANLLRNASFDTDISEWLVAGNHDGTVWDAEGHDAPGSMRLVGTGTGTGLTNGVRQNSIAGISPGQLYTLSFWSKRLGGSPTLTARLSGGGLRVTSAGGGNPWQLVTSSDVASSANLYFYVNGPGVWRVDNVRVNEGLSVAGSTVAHYRFEEGSGTSVINEVDGRSDGSMTGGGTFTSDTPGSVAGVANNFAADFTNGFARITEQNFIFHEPNGDATVEWFAKVPAGHSHASFFWTENGEGEGNMNLFWNASFAGQTDTVAADLWPDEPITGTINGETHWSTLDQSPPFPEDEWFHVAIVRTDTDGGAGTDFSWDWYLNGTELSNHFATTDRTPPGVNNGWLICGRGQVDSLSAKIDEIRLSGEALDPNEFLNATGGGNGDDVPNFLPNGSFDNNDSGWSKTGNHGGSVWTSEDSQDESSGSEEVVSTGTGGSSTNSFNISNIPGVTMGSSYTLSFYAKYISGEPSLTARFSGSSHLVTVEALGSGGGSDVPPPPISGTVGFGSPGKANSVEASGLAPFVRSLDHLIEKPTSSQSMPVLATVTSDTGLQSVTLQYSRDLSSSVQSVTMFDDGAHADGAAGDGVYAGTIPAQSSQTFVHYWVRAEDVDGRITRYPYEDEPSSTQAYYHYNGEINTGITLFDLFLSTADLNKLTRDPYGGAYVDASVAIDGIAYPHIGVRLRGRGSRVNPKHQWKFRFNRQQLYDGNRVLDTMLNRPYIQRAAFDIFDLVSPPPAGLGSDLIRVHRGGSFFGVYVAFESPNSTWLRKYGLDPDGEIYKARSVETSGQAKNSDLYRNQLISDIDYWGAYNKKTNPLEPPDGIRNLVAALNDMSDTQLLPYLDENVDLDQYFTRWAMYILMVIDDFAGHNFYIYRPVGGKWQNLAYDFCGLGRFSGGLRLDYGDGCCGDSAAWQRNKFLQRCSNNPTLAQIYHLKMEELKDTVFKTSFIFPKLDFLFNRASTDLALDRSRWNTSVSSTSSIKNTFSAQLGRMVTALNNENLPPDSHIPVANPLGGDFVDSASVTLSAPAGWNIVYTVDGGDPRLATSAEFYSGAFTITESGTLKAAAYSGSRSSGNWTRLGEWDFSIDSTPPGPGPFIRGDCDGDGIVGGGLEDALFLLFRNFQGVGVPPCEAACDANSDGIVSGVADAVSLLVFGYANGFPPAAPFPGCGFGNLSTDETLGCASSVACP